MSDATVLAGLCVAITRPAGLNDRLLQRLRELGAEATAIPLLRIEPLETPPQLLAIDTLFAQLKDVQHAIFISQNAAEQAIAALVARGQVWPASVQASAVGTTTAACLRAHGIEAISPARMDSEGLLALPQLQNVADQRIVIFRGLGGRETLAQTLRARGASVDYCELYRRSLPTEAAQQWAQWLLQLTQREGLACINSVESLQHVLSIDINAPNRDNLTVLVPSVRVAQAATTAGFNRILTANDAMDDTVIQHIIDWAAAAGRPLRDRTP
jgi:uroporphyrinogen-III synthase